MEKEHQPESMATVQMKPEYAPSEVYSASEPPPVYRTLERRRLSSRTQSLDQAYRQRLSNSVQIARIVAYTVVLSSFILGSFILASSYVSARAGCQQLEQLDAMLDKELALEGRQLQAEGLLGEEPLPLNNAHALHQTPAPLLSASHAKEQDALQHSDSNVNEEKLQSLDADDSKEDDDSSSESASSSSSSSSSSTEEEEDLDRTPVHIKLPMHFDLDELAGAFLANNQKSRMSCVVERHPEERDAGERDMASVFPFNVLAALGGRAPRAAAGAGERVAIICEANEEERPMPDPLAQVFAFPLTGPVRLPMARPAGPNPLPAALQPPPPPAPMQHQMPMLPWGPMREGPSEPREVRVHVQRVFAMPAGRMPPPTPNQHFAPPPQMDEQSEFHLQPMHMQMLGGLGGLGPLGLSPSDLRAIHRTVQQTVAAAANAAQRDAEDGSIDNDMQEVKTIVNSLEAAAQAAASREAEESQERRSEDDNESDNGNPMHVMSGMPTMNVMHPMSDGMPPMDVPMSGAAMPMSDAAMPMTSAAMPMPVDRRAHARGLPVHIPVNMMTQEQQLPIEEERPHYVQPRSVRSVDSLLHREKRVKRFACSCV